MKMLQKQNLWWQINVGKIDEAVLCYQDYHGRDWDPVVYWSCITKFYGSVVPMEL